MFLCFSEDDFVSPVQKLTKEELHEELKAFESTNRNTSHALRANDNNNDDDSDDDTGELQFRMQQPLQNSICCCQYDFSWKQSSCVTL